MSLQLKDLSGPLLVALANYPQSRATGFAQQVWRLALRIEEDILKPQNLAGAAVKFLSFTVVSRN